MYFTRGPGGARRRALELDRGGTLLAVLHWSTDGLTAAWLRLDDHGWLTIEPRASGDAPWGLSDRLGRADRFGGHSTPLTLMEALDWTRVDRIPTVAEPARLPAGTGTIVLNLIAALADDQQSGPLAYRGPYPSEQLFVALLESFRYEPADDDPLTAFVAGGLRWTPAPHERVFAAEGAVVHLRDRIEKVVWRGRTYVRSDWPGVGRRAPRRVREVQDGVRCSLWALGEAVEDHLLLSADGEVRRTLSPPPPPPERRPLPAVVGAGVGAIVAATSAPALAAVIRDDAGGLELAWAPVVDDLVAVDGRSVRLSTRLRATATARLAPLAPEDRAMAGLGLLSEIALLLADGIRLRAQARVASLPAAKQAALLEAPAAPDPDAARTITDAVEALLTTLAP